MLSDRILRRETSWQGWLPVAITVFVSACALILSQALHSQERASVHRQAAAEAHRLSNDLLQQVRSLETALERMRARYEAGSVVSQVAWEADAREHLRGHGGVLNSLVITDASGSPRWVVPATLAPHLRDMGAARAPERTAAFVRATTQHEPVTYAASSDVAGHTSWLHHPARPA